MPEAVGFTVGQVWVGSGMSVTPDSRKELNLGRSTGNRHGEDRRAE